MLSDTGFYCRNVLGMNRDDNQITGKRAKPGTGGVRNYGSHQEMVTFVDDFSKRLKILLAARMSYKSSIVEGLIQRCLLAYPNFRILLMMHSLKKSEQRVRTIRDEMRNNPIVKELFGDIKGPIWNQGQFTTNLRTDTTLLDPSLSCGSPDALPTGGHYDLIILDDIVDLDNVQTPEAVAKTVECVKYVMPLRSQGGIVLDIGTPYDEADVHAFLLGMRGWERLILDVGYEVVQLEDQRHDLIGEPRFPHLGREFLLEQLELGYTYFMSQYKLRIVGQSHSNFKREQFTPVSWKEDFQDLTGYLLTDIATGDRTAGALNVLAYCGLDERRRLYILDLECGHWPISEFVDRFHNMRARWSAKVNHQAELLEITSANNAYKHTLNAEAKNRNIRLNLQLVNRGGGDLSKDQRILVLQPRFSAREVFIVSTVPRTWVHMTKLKILWDPDGFVDPDSGAVLPDGELVAQFIRHPVYKLKDIPDAISMIDTWDKSTGQMLCFYRKPSRRMVSETILRRPAAAKAGGFMARGAASRFYDRASRKVGM